MKVSRIVLALACCSALVGCGSVERQVCARADECNALRSGDSVDDCTERKLQCTESLTSSEQADWETLAGNCLELRTCSNFVSCYNDDVPKC